MKVCPICQNSYEDWIDFCFQDGMPLVAGGVGSGAAPPPPEKKAPPRPPPAASAHDAPEPRIAAFDAPEPTNLARFKKPSPPAVPLTPTAPLRPPVQRPRHEAPADAPAPRSEPEPEERTTPAAAPEPPAPVEAPAAEAPPPTAAVDEGEDGKPTMPMFTPLPEPEAPRGRSVLDEPDTARVAAAGGAGIAIAGLLGMGLLIVVLVGGGWWFFGRKTADAPAPPVARTAPAPAPLPAPIPPKPVEPPPPPPPPVEEEATEPAVEAAPAVAAPAAPSRPAAPTRPSTPSRPTPAPTPSRPVAAAATPASSTSDNVWGAPDVASTGVLKINSDPLGASIYVNDELKGRAPLTVELPYGRHRIRAVQAGYKTEISDVNLNVREMAVPLRMTAELQQGQVNVYGPSGATVWVDNHDMGPLPVTVIVSEGLRQFKLGMPDGNTCTVSKEIRFAVPGRPFTLNLTACPP